MALDALPAFHPQAQRGEGFAARLKVNPSAEELRTLQVQSLSGHSWGQHSRVLSQIRITNNLEEYFPSPSSTGRLFLRQF